MKLNKSIVALTSLVAFAATPLFAGTGKTFKETVVVEEEESSWYNAALSTGWDSLYMFRGANVLRSGGYGSSLYWTDASFTWNISDNDFLTLGGWNAFGLGQGTSYGFRQGLNDRLLSEPKLGTKKPTAREGQGTYVNTKGELELNPLQAIDVPRAGNIGEGAKANTALRQQVAQMGTDLNQEAMAGHRFLPMMTNNIKDASSMLIKTKEGLSKEQIADLARALGNDMVVTHNPKLGGVVVYPFGPVTKGQIPQEFLTAQSAANKLLGKDAKIKFGKSDYAKDRLYMGKDEYAKAGASPMSAEQQALREKIQGIEKFMFPESVSGIPGSVKASPIGGLQPWSRGAEYPTSVIGIGNGSKVEYQPVNFLTDAKGKRYPTYREAEQERSKMLEGWHRTLPSRVR